MPRQKLTTRQKRIIKLAYKCGIMGFANSGPYEQGKYPELPNFSSEEDLDNFENYLRDFAALQESLRSPN